MRIIVIALDARDAAPEVEAFESRGDTVQLAATLGPWVEECDHGRYQLVLLVNPLTSGHHDVCRELRRRGATVPIVVAARSCCDSSDRVKGLTAGAAQLLPPPCEEEG